MWRYGNFSLFAIFHGAMEYKYERCVQLDGHPVNWIKHEFFFLSRAFTSSGLQHNEHISLRIANIVNSAIFRISMFHIWFSSNEVRSERHWIAIRTLRDGLLYFEWQLWAITSRINRIKERFCQHQKKFYIFSLVFSWATLPTIDLLALVEYTVCSFPQSIGAALNVIRRSDIFTWNFSISKIFTLIPDRRHTSPMPIVLSVCAEMAMRVRTKFPDSDRIHKIVSNALSICLHHHHPSTSDNKLCYKLQ